MDQPLAERVAVVTGVSRRSGIGFAITRRLLAAGASVLAHGWSPHDSDQPWRADPGGIQAVLEALGGPSPRLAQIEADFAQPDSPSAVIDEAVRLFGSGPGCGQRTGLRSADRVAVVDPATSPPSSAAREPPVNVVDVLSQVDGIIMAPQWCHFSTDHTRAGGEPCPF